MNRLKTLNEIIKNQVVCDFSPACESIESEDLRNEAIKWISEINKQQYEIDNWTHDELVVNKYKINCGEYTCNFVVEWIKCFFNIKKEDLK